MALQEGSIAYVGHLRTAGQLIARDAVIQALNFGGAGCCFLSICVFTGLRFGADGRFQGRFHTGKPLALQEGSIAYVGHLRTGRKFVGRNAVVQALNFCFSGCCFLSVGAFTGLRFPGVCRLTGMGFGGVCRLSRLDFCGQVCGQGQVCPLTAGRLFTQGRFHTAEAFALQERGIGHVRYLCARGQFVCGKAFFQGRVGGFSGLRFGGNLGF